MSEHTPLRHKPANANGSSFLPSSDTAFAPPTSTSLSRESSTAPQTTPDRSSSVQETTPDQELADLQAQLESQYSLSYDFGSMAIARPTGTSVANSAEEPPRSNGTHPTIQRKGVSSSRSSVAGHAPMQGHDFSRISIQPKLTIGQPNDAYEQEADRVAEQVMRMPEPGNSGSAASAGFAGHDFSRITVLSRSQSSLAEGSISQQTIEPETAGEKPRKETFDSDPKQVPNLTVRSKKSKQRQHKRKENKNHHDASDKAILIANTSKARQAIADAQSAVREVGREGNKKTNRDGENQLQENTRRKAQQEGTKTGKAEASLNLERAARNEPVANLDAKDQIDNNATRAVKEAQDIGLNRLQRSAAIQQTADTEVSLAKPPVKSMLMTTQEGIDVLQPDEIFGSAGNGMVLFQTSNPEQYLSIADQGIDIRQVPDEQADQYRETQRLQIEAAIARFVASGRARIASITSMSQTVRPRIQKAAQQTKVSIQAAIKQNRNTITNKLDQAREQVQEKANAVRGQINTRHGSAIAAIRSSTATARTRLESAYQANIEKLDQLDQSLSSRLDDSLNRGANKFRDKGSEAAGEVDTIANEFKNRFDRESPPEPSNRVTEFLESFDRDTYTENWRNAKKDAADNVASQYKKGLVDNANQKAGELKDTKDGHLQQLQELIKTTRTNLETQYTSALQGLNQAEQTAIQTANQALDSQLDNLDQSLNAALDGLKQTKTDQLNQLNSSAKQQQADVDIKANSVITTLQEKISQGAAGVEGALQDFVAQAQGVESPNLITIQSVTAEAQDQLNQAIATTRSELNTCLKNSEQGLTQEGQQVVARLSQIGQQAESQAKTSVEEFSTGAAQVEEAATQVFTQMQEGHTSMMQSRADQSVTGLDQVAANASTQVDGFFTNLDTGLETSAGELKTGLVNSLEGDSENKGLRETIEEEARIAAEQVQPAWKQIAKVIVDIVITVAVTVAIAALAASGIGMVAVVLLAAAIGAAGGLLKQAANDAIDGKRSSWQEYAKQAGIGAASGVLQAVGLRGGDKLAGAIANQFGKRAAQAGIEAATDTVIDVGTQVANGEQFSLNMLATSAGLSLLGSAGGEALSGSFGRLGQQVGRSDAGQRAVSDAGQRTASDAGQGAASNAGQRAIAEGGEFVAEVTVDTGVGVADRMLQGEDFSAGMLAASAGEAALGSVVGRRADQLYGDQLRGLGQNRGDAEGGTSSPDPSQPDVDVNVDTPQVPEVSVDRPPGNLTPPTPEVVDTPAGRRTEDTPESVTPDSSSTRPARETSEPTQTPDGIRNQPDRTPDPTRDRSPEKPAEPTPDTINRPLRDPSEQSQTPDPNKRPVDQTPRQPEKGSDRPLTEPTQDPNLLEGLPPDLRDQIPIHVDPTLTGNTVRVHYTRENGVITNIHMRVGPNATQRDIELHVQTARMMQRYSGFSGRIRMLKERIQNWISRNGEPPVGSRAWEAQLEIDKLPRIIDDRLEQLSRGDLDPATEAALQADIENLEQQLARHQQTLDEMDTDPGVGFVAADSARRSTTEVELKAQIKEREEQADKLREDLEEAMDQSRAAETEVSHARNELKAAKDKTQQARDNVEETKRKVEEARETVQRQAVELQAQQALRELKASEQELAKVEDDLKQATEEQQEAQEIWKLAREEQKEAQEQEELARQLEALARLEASESQQEALKREKEPFEDQLKGLNRKIDRQEEIMQELDNRIRELYIEHREGRIGEEGHARARDKIDADRRRVKAKITRLTEQRIPLKRKIKDIDSRLDIQERRAQETAQGIADRLRKYSPSSAARAYVNSGDSPWYEIDPRRPDKKIPIDPVYRIPIDKLFPGTSPTSLSPDHIFPLVKIVMLPGFSQLTYEQQKEVVEIRENLMGVHVLVNSSKQDESWRTYQGHPNLGNIDPGIKSRLIAAEDAGRKAVEAAIQERLP